MDESTPLETPRYEDEFQKSTDDDLVENLLNDDDDDDSLPGNDDNDSLPTKSLQSSSRHSRSRSNLLPQSTSHSNTTTNAQRSERTQSSKPNSAKSTKSNASTFNVTKKQFTSQITDLSATINDLTKQVENAEYRANIAEKEAESRKETIDKLKHLHSKALEDFNGSNSHLSMRNEQINSLKDTVKTLKQQLQDMLSEKQTVELKLQNSEETVASKTSEIEKLRHDLDASLDDLNQHPAFIKIVQRNEELRKAVNMEKEGRIAALSAWQKMEKQIKSIESKHAQKESTYIKDVRDLRVKHEEIQQQLKWNNEKLEMTRDSNKNLESDYKMIQEENLNLKMRLNSMETEIRSQAALEQMKSKNFIDGAMTEMKWREHLLIQQLEKLKQKLNLEQIQKFKYQKAVRTMEVELGQQQQRRVQQSEPQNTAIVKRKFAEMSDLDAEINKLKREIKEEQRSPMRRDKWIRNPPQPIFLQSPMPTVPAMHQQIQHQQFQNQQQHQFQSPQQPVLGNHGVFTSPMPPHGTRQVPFASPNQGMGGMSMHNNGRHQPHHLNVNNGGIYYDDKNIRIRDAMQQRPSNHSISTKYSSPLKAAGRRHMQNGAISNAEYRSPRNEADNFWSDLTDHPTKTLQKFNHQFHKQYAESDKERVRRSKKTQLRRGASHRSSDNAKPKKRRATHAGVPKTRKRLSESELPRWR